MTHLVAILLNPSLGPGRLTLNRVSLGAHLLGHDSFAVVNLFGQATHNSQGIKAHSDISHELEVQREVISSSIAGCDEVLLGYGRSAPPQVLRSYYAEQIQHVQAQVHAKKRDAVSVGGEPWHPSRWQRYTYRAYPGIAFEQALGLSFVRIAADKTGVDIA